MLTAYFDDTGKTSGAELVIGAFGLVSTTEKWANSVHIDVLASAASESVAIELKYKTRNLEVTAKGERFDLANQAAQDTGRYDFIKDVQRLEGLVATHRGMSGCAILLSNDSSYWTQAHRVDSVDAAFRLDPGRVISGRRAWRRRASAGTVRGREKRLLLAGTYTIAWRDYSDVGADRYGAFRYLAIEVLNRDASSTSLAVAR